MSVERTSERPIKNGCNAGHGDSSSENMSSENSDHIGDGLTQNGEKQQVKTATTRVHNFTALKMRFRNYYAALTWCVAQVNCLVIYYSVMCESVRKESPRLKTIIYKTAIQQCHMVGDIGR